MKKQILLVGTLLLLSFQLFAATSEAEIEINRALNLYNQERYEECDEIVHAILQKEEWYYYHADAWFILSKSAMTRDLPENAMIYLTNYFKSYPEDSPYYLEALYLQGRLYFSEGMYEEALEKFTSIIDDYQPSEFTTFALYWIGEYYFMAGETNRAVIYYQQVIEADDSSRTADARMRILIIENQELRDLLQWSHEEFLKNNLNNERGLESYQTQILELSKQVEELRLQQELLDIQEELLQLKEFYLRELEAANVY